MQEIYTFAEVAAKSTYFSMSNKGCNTPVSSCANSGYPMLPTGQDAEKAVPEDDSEKCLKICSA